MAGMGAKAAYHCGKKSSPMSNTRGVADPHNEDISGIDSFI